MDKEKNVALDLEKMQAEINEIRELEGLPAKEVSDKNLGEAIEYVYHKSFETHIDLLEMGSIIQLYIEVASFDDEKAKKEIEKHLKAFNISKKDMETSEISNWIKIFDECKKLLKIIKNNPMDIYQIFSNPGFVSQKYDIRKEHVEFFGELLKEFHVKKKEFEKTNNIFNKE